MISWEKQLSPLQIAQVSNFILSLEGTSPPNPKAPEGEKWTEQTVSSALDGSLNPKSEEKK